MRLGKRARTEAPQQTRHPLDPVRAEIARGDSRLKKIQLRSQNQPGAVLQFLIEIVSEPEKGYRGVVTIQQQPGHRCAEPMCQPVMEMRVSDGNNHLFYEPGSEARRLTDEEAVVCADRVETIPNGHAEAALAIEALKTRAIKLGRNE